MEHEKELVLARNSDRGTAVVARALYLVVSPPVKSDLAPNGRVPSWMESESAERDAPITVWWEYPPN
jgi:hypothetical protein